MEQRTYALGERYIGAGKRTGKIELYEVPGNALGTYLDGAEIVLHANAQDATGDTMNAGEITIYGSTATRPATRCAAAASTCRATPATGRAST